MSQRRYRASDDERRVAATDDVQGIRAKTILRRSRKIVAVVVRRGTSAGWHTAASRLRHHDIDQADSFPRQLRLALEELGPTFVKLGQLLSARSDLTPPQVQQELSKLWDHAPSISQAELAAELERSLGSPSTALFATLDGAGGVRVDWPGTSGIPAQWPSCGGKGTASRGPRRY